MSDALERLSNALPPNALAGGQQNPTARLEHLAREIKQTIAQHVEILQMAWEKGKPYAVKAGLLLVEAKGLTHHGEWEAWVAANCCDERTAQRYMRIASHKDDPRLIAAEEEAKATGRALSIEDAERALRKKREPKAEPAPPPEQSDGENAPRTDDRKAEAHKVERGRDSDGDDEERILDLSNEMLEEALATITELVADDPWETLLEVVLILGLDWTEVATWAQRQAEMGDESDEAVTPEATLPEPVVAKPAAPQGSTEPQNSIMERSSCDEGAHSAPKETTAENEDAQPAAKVEQHTGSEPATKAPSDEGSHPNIANKASGPRTLAPLLAQELEEVENEARERPRSVEVDAPSPAITSLKSQPEAPTKEMPDLPNLVLGILGRNPSGLKLDQITVKVINAGYKTQSQNLVQAVYAILAVLMKNGKVVKTIETKKYNLATPEEREMILRENQQEEERAKQKEHEARELAIIDRLESLLCIGKALTKARGILATVYGSMATFRGEDREGLDDLAEKMYEAAQNVAATLELENSDGVSVDATQPCSRDEARQLLVEAEGLIARADNKLDAMKATDEECKGLRAEGQKTFDLAYGIARMLGVD